MLRFTVIVTVNPKICNVKVIGINSHLLSEELEGRNRQLFPYVIPLGIKYQKSPDLSRGEKKSTAVFGSVPDCGGAGFHFSAQLLSTIFP